MCIYIARLRRGGQVGRLYPSAQNKENSPKEMVRCFKNTSAHTIPKKKKKKRFCGSIIFPYFKPNTTPIHPRPKIE